MKKYFALLTFLTLLVLSSSCSSEKKEAASQPSVSTSLNNIQFVTSKTFGKAYNFMIVSDWGWNGYKYQQEVADQMAKTADSIDAKFIATCGDNFQTNGVGSIQDPLWMSNFENIYKCPSLLVDWYPVLGNHDYKGNTQAEIDYSKISRRWRLSDRYYSFAKKVNDSVSARFVFLDTPPLISEYRNNPQQYPDAVKQDISREMKWLNNVLSDSGEQWKIVFGHHPVYSASLKHGNTDEMIAYVKPLLEKYNAQFYICGHDHDFQHLQEKGGKVEYIVTGTGGEVRPCNSNEMSLFSRSEPGFSIVSLKGDSLRICFVGTEGNIIYSFARSY